MLHGVRDERDHEADEQHLLAVEEAVGRGANATAPITENAMSETGEHRARPGGFAHDGPAADGPRAPVGDGAAHLLLERQEEARRDDEHEDPQAVERGVLRLGQALERQDLEPVRGDAGDDEAEADRIGAFGDGQSCERLR